MGEEKKDEAKQDNSARTSESSKNQKKPVRPRHQGRTFSGEGIEKHG
jgi:hypothetical protein